MGGLIEPRLVGGRYVSNWVRRDGGTKHHHLYSPGGISKLQLWEFSVFRVCSKEALFRAYGYPQVSRMRIGAPGEDETSKPAKELNSKYPGTFG